MKFLLILLVSTSFLLASVSKGKTIYKKQCVQCHLEGKYFASHKKAKAWAKVLDSNVLYEHHLDRNISLPYLNSVGFQKDKKHLKALLQKYSKDRGKHNSCH